MITINYGNFRKSIEESAKDKTQAEKRGEWIPVSERLPETYGEYIVTRKTEYGIKTKTSLYYENGIWWPPEEVIAWMDLPEPYKDPNNDD